MTQTISFDFDGVIFPSLDKEKYLFFLGKGIHLPIDIGDRINLKLLQQLYSSNLSIKKLYSEFIHERYYLRSSEFKCDPTILDTLDSLKKKGFKLNIITKRSAYIKNKNYTKIWLELNGIYSFFDGIYFTDGKSKNSILESTSTSIYVDNDLDALLEYKKNNPLIKYIYWSSLPVNYDIFSTCGWINFTKTLEDDILNK